MTEPLDLDALSQQHYGPDGIVTDPECVCGEPWPCPTSTLIQVVRRQSEALKLIGNQGSRHPFDTRLNGVDLAEYARELLTETAALVDLGGDDD